MTEPPPVVSTPYGVSFLPSGDRRHESSDVNVFWIVVFATGMAIGAVLVHAVLWLFFQGLALAEPRKEQRPPPPADARPHVPPEPRLQLNDVADLRTLREAEDARMTQYQWIDKPAGIARIPISRAMELVTERGLPQWKKGSDEISRDAFGNLRVGGKNLEQEKRNER
jgi:hypothetical protein